VPTNAASLETCHFFVVYAWLLAIGKHKIGLNSVDFLEGRPAESLTGAPKQESSLLLYTVDGQELQSEQHGKILPERALRAHMLIRLAARMPIGQV